MLENDHEHFSFGDFVISCRFKSIITESLAWVGIEDFSHKNIMYTGISQHKYICIFT